MNRENIEKLINEICEEFQIEKKSLFGKTQIASIVKIRHCLIYVFSVYTSLNSYEIAEIMSKNRSICTYVTRKMEYERNQYSDISEIIEKILVILEKYNLENYTDYKMTKDKAFNTLLSFRYYLTGESEIRPISAKLIDAIDYLLKEREAKAI